MARSRLTFPASRVAMHRSHGFWTNDDGERIEKTYANLELGILPVEALDDEEVEKAKLREEDGSFAAGSPVRLSGLLQGKLFREQRHRLSRKHAAMMTDAYRVLHEIILDDTGGVTAGEKLRGIEMALNRTEGPVAQKHEVTANVTMFDELIADAVILETVEVEEESGE